MKKLWAWLRALNAGDWIALVAFLGGSAFVLALITVNVWSTVLGVLQPEVVKIKGVDYDLVAQRSMAAAAWWMVGFTAVSSVVGAFGLYLIFRTVQETARSADAALLSAQTAQAAMKPFVTVEFANILMDDDGFIRINYKVRNSGSSPAYDVAFTVTFSVLSIAERDQEFTETSTKSRSDIEAGGTKKATASFRRDGAAMVADDGGNFVVFAMIEVFYRDIFRSQERISVRYGRYMNYFSMRNEVSLYRDVDTFGWGD